MPENHVVRPLTIQDGKHPHEVLFLVACFAAGIGGALNPEARSRGLEAMFGSTVGASTWYVALAIGAAISLTGIYQKPPNSLLVERIGMALVGALCASYSIGVVAVSGWLGIFTGLITLAFAASCLLRILRIRKDLRLLRQALQQRTTAGPILGDPRDGQ